MKVSLLYSSFLTSCCLFFSGGSHLLGQSDLPAEPAGVASPAIQDNTSVSQDTLVREILVADPTNESGVARLTERIQLQFQEKLTDSAETDSGPHQQEQEASQANEALQKAVITLHLQQHMQQLSVTMKSLGRQLESLEKLENSIRSEALPSKSKLHSAAEAFGLALQEHLEALKSEETLAKNHLSRIDEANHELALLARLAEVRGLQNNVAVDVADIARAAKTPEAAASIAEKAEILGQADMDAVSRGKLFLERMMSDVESARALEEVVRSNAMAAAIKAKLQADEDILKAKVEELARLKEERLAPASEQMEKLEGRLNRIEALLEKLMSEKTEK
ncbi:MAG: hypothetical protein JNL67_02110 [Planctomycetaceae bacterium]|nr:hypothetical protein [Planctomycetaceae bacterium]